MQRPRPTHSRILFNISAINPGSCQINVASHDQSPIPIPVDVAGPLTVSPATFGMSVGGSVNGFPASQTITHSKTNDPFALSYYNYSGCAGMLGAPATGTGSAGGAQNSTATVNETFVPSAYPAGTAPQTCTFTMNDQYGEYDSVGITIYSALAAGSPNGTQTGQTTATLNSSAPSGGYGSGYAVTYYYAGGAFACGPVVYACNLSGLNPGTTYTLYATYVDGVSDQVNSAGNFTFTTASAPPFVAGTPSFVTATQTSITVTSTAPSGGTGTGYSVSYVTNTGQTCGPAVYSCTINGLVANTSYTITATYGDNGGHSATATTAGLTSAPPSTPLVAGVGSTVNASTSAVSLTSTPPSGGTGTGYYVTYTVFVGFLNTPTCTGTYNCIVSSSYTAGQTYNIIPTYYDSAGASVNGATFTAVIPAAATPPPLTNADLTLECTSLYATYTSTNFIGGSGPFGPFSHKNNSYPNPYGVAYFLGVGGTTTNELIGAGTGFFSAHRDDYYFAQAQHFFVAQGSLGGPRQNASFLYAESTHLLLVAPWSGTNNAPNSGGTSCVVKDDVVGWQ